jgi:hypothetical protein
MTLLQDLSGGDVMCLLLYADTLTRLCFWRMVVAVCILLNQSCVVVS